MKTTKEIIKDNLQSYIDEWEMQPGDITGQLESLLKDYLHEVIYELIPERAVSKTNIEINNKYFVSKSSRDAFNCAIDKVIENYIKFNNQ